MSMNAALGAVGFRYMILEQYKGLGLNENELAVLLMVDHLLEQGNTLINADNLSLKMTMESKEIDALLAGLLKKQMISYEMKDGKLVTTLDPIYRKLSRDLAKKMRYEEEKAKEEETQKRITILNDLFEERFSRTLTPLEKGKLTDWVLAGYKVDEVENALKDSIREGKPNIKFIDRRLRARRAASDIEEEGYTATSPNWEKDISSSLKIAKDKWDDEE